MRTEASFSFAALLCGAALAVLLAVSPRRAVAADTIGFEGTDFKVPLENFAPPNETQIKTLLEGAKAQPGSNGKIVLTDARLTTFNTNGILETLTTAPSCVFDSVDHTLSSSGPLRMQTADKKFVLEGMGFLIQTNSVLIISNRVRTLVQGASTNSFLP
jgi:hypothetical protein